MAPRDCYLAPRRCIHHIELLLAWLLGLVSGLILELRWLTIGDTIPQMVDGMLRLEANDTRDMH